jgi:hypothetical protein
MDLLDIFDAEKPKPQPIDAVAVSEAVSDDLCVTLDEQALAAASAYDAADAANVAFKNEAARIQSEADLRLKSLADKRDETKKILDETLTGLMAAMDKDGITKIPMKDRPDIFIKVFPGRKKPITKKWLIETYGDEQAKKVWDAVPKLPEKRGVIVPARYEDEPEPD